jgi:hypothetical protein
LGCGPPGRKSALGEIISTAALHADMNAPMGDPDRVGNHVPQD